MGMVATTGTPVFLQHLRRGRQQRRVATELVEYKALDQARAHRLQQQCPGAVQMGKRAAAVYVSHQQAARLGVAPRAC